MNRKGDLELRKVISFIIYAAVLVVIIVGVVYLLLGGNIKKLGDAVINPVMNSLSKLGISDIFVETPSTPGAMTQEQKDKASAQKYMDGRFLEANQLSSGIETFDERFCTQDLVNRFKTASDTYNEYIKNCANTKSKYYNGCRDDNKTISQNQINKINIIFDKCQFKLGDINKQVNELPSNIKALLDDAEKYEKIGNYNTAIEKLKAYIIELEKDKEKNRNLINEAYIKLIKDYMILGKDYYKDIFIIFKDNENLKVLMPNEYKKVVLELAEPLSCNEYDTKECIEYNIDMSLKLKYDLGEIKWKLTKEDAKEYRKLSCFIRDNKCLSCETVNIKKCEDYDEGNSDNWIISCENDPCFVGLKGCFMEKNWYDNKCKPK